MSDPILFAPVGVKGKYHPPTDVAQQQWHSYIGPTPDRRVVMPSRTARAAMLLLLSISPAAAQSIDDGLMMPKGTLSLGVLYAHDSWDEYWEGPLKRTNGNIGTLSAQSVTGMVGYGLADRLSVMASLPYVKTHASQGVLHDESGFQDITIAAKLRLAGARSETRGALGLFVVGTGAVPVSDYTPDFYPLSIGTGGGRASVRVTVSYKSPSLWFVNASSAYTFCSNVKLNRSSYYTDGRLYLTNEVAMPNVIDYTLTTGLDRGRLRIPVSLVQQRTLGGGDIRRQDMPFVSNRMNFTRVDGSVMYALPGNFSARLGAARVIGGRNVGQSTTFTTGVSYAHQF